MNPLTARRRRHPADEQLSFALTRQLGNMELATSVTQTRIYGITMVHQEASHQVAQTIATADQLVKAAASAGQITPAKASELRRRTQEYLHEMLGIAHDTSGKLIDLL